MHHFKRIAVLLTALLGATLASNALADPPLVEVNQTYSNHSPAVNIRNLQTALGANPTNPVGSYVLAKFVNGNGTNTYQVFVRTNNQTSTQWAPASDSATPPGPPGGGGGGGGGSAYSLTNSSGWWSINFTSNGCGLYEVCYPGQTY